MPKVKTDEPVVSLIMQNVRDRIALIEKAHTDRGWSRYGFVQHYKLSPATYSRMLDEYPVSLPVLEDWAKKLGVPFFWLLGATERNLKNIEDFPLNTTPLPPQKPPPKKRVSTPESRAIRAAKRRESYRLEKLQRLAQQNSP